MMTEHHPEELIDRARQGALAPAEQSTLQDHLATCPVCAALLEQAAWLDRVAARPRDELLDQRAVEAAMARMQQTRRPSPAGRSHAWPRWLRLAAAGVLLASGITATAAIVGRMQAPPGPDPVSVPRPVQPSVARLAPTPVPPPADLPEPGEPLRPNPHPRPAPVPARPAVTAAALFEHAGHLRRAGRADAAIAVYRRLQATFPEARETQLSYVLAGKLLLETGRSSDALAQFDRHPRIGGDVAEEVLAGRAAALEQLHRTTDAIAAWKSLLERYPGSVYAARARARLAQLGAPR
jgi:tetratricopeptide (TPR) repeat protein